MAIENLMIDLETLGNGPNSVILAVGAVAFNEAGVGADFYRVVDPQSCVDAGLKMDVSTVMWWMGQSDAARDAVRRRGEPLATVLAELAAIIDPKVTCVWGNGATFDNVILANAYRARHKPTPWAFWNDRCYRTLKALRPDIEFARTGTHHNALDDARAQAEHAVRILRALRGAV